MTRDNLIDEFNSSFTNKLDLSQLLFGELTSDSTFRLSYKTFAETKSIGKTEIKGVFNYYPKSTEVVIEVSPNTGFVILTVLFFLLGLVFILFSFLETQLNYYKLFVGLFMTILLPIFLFNYSQLTKNDLVNQFEKKLNLDRLSTT